jgi:hypothetical protein
MRTRLLLLVFAISVTFMACQKEPDDSIFDPPANTTCKVEKVSYFDETTGAVDDTAGFVYSGDQLTRVNYTDFYLTLEYSGNKISKRNFLLDGTTALLAYDTYSYNGDGTMSKIESFFQDPVTSTPVIYARYNFTYASGKLASVATTTDTSAAGGGPLVPYYTETFTWTGNNATRVISEYMEDHTKDTLDYQYDNIPNYFAKHPALYADNLFIEIDPVYFPLVLSANNVTRISLGGGSSTLGYTATDKDLLKDFSIGGKITSSYQYKCQ